MNSECNIKIKEKTICEKCGLDLNKMFKCPRCKHIQCLCGTKNISIPEYWRCLKCGWDIFMLKIYIKDEKRYI